MRNEAKNSEAWYHQMPGEMLLSMEHRMLSRFISHVKGDYLIQLGGPDNLSMVKECPIVHKYSVNATLPQSHSLESIVAEAMDLPFLEKSIQVFVLIHLLEFISHPTQFLRQIKDALTPNGYLIIFGLNYWSLWNVSRLWKGKDFPWNGHFYSKSTVEYWLHSLGFHVVTTRTGCFRLPFRHHKVANKLLFLEPLGQFFFPGMGGFYMIIAQKREFAKNFQKEKAWSKKYLVGNNSIAKPTTRNL